MSQTQEETQLLNVAEETKKTFKDRLKLTLSGLSGAYMLPISTLILVAMFLSLGSFIETQFSENHNGQKFGTLIKSLAYPLLQAIPLLFCLAFTFSFCKGDTTCIWNSLLAYLVFLSVQGIFIMEHQNGYVIMFEAGGRTPQRMANMVESNLGFKCMSTSIFGAFIIGGVMMPYIHRKWCNVHLKGPFAFFSGKRFVPFLSVIGAAVVAIYFLIIWPWVGFAMSKLGEWLSKTPAGVDSFLFGLLEKSLIPTGLHHMFYAPIWFSPIGGDAAARMNEVVTACSGSGGSEFTTGSSSSSLPSCSVVNSALSTLSTHDRPGTSAKTLANIIGKGALGKSMWQGDSFLGLSIISLPSNTINNKSVFDFFTNDLGINVGRYTQGKYPIMQFCLPAAAVGMSLASKNPSKTIKVFLPGILSSALMGITEPLEFTFLFAMPSLFYGFHAVMCGFSFMLMNLFGAHIPSILSGGLIELIILGVLPMNKGTQWYFYLATGAILSPLYLGMFYTMIKTGKLKVAGVNESEDSNVDAQMHQTESKVPEATRKLALALGGWDNVSKYSNCASRLRYDIVDKSKVNEAALKSSGVIAIKWIGDNHLQAIVGPKAEMINNEMLKWKGEPI